MKAAAPEAGTDTGAAAPGTAAEAGMPEDGEAFANIPLLENDGFEPIHMELTNVCFVG